MYVIPYNMETLMYLKEKRRLSFSCIVYSDCPKNALDPPWSRWTYQKTHAAHSFKRGSTVQRMQWTKQLWLSVLDIWLQCYEILNGTSSTWHWVHHVLFLQQTLFIIKLRTVACEILVMLRQTVKVFTNMSIDTILHAFRCLMNKRFKSAKINNWFK